MRKMKTESIIQNRKGKVNFHKSINTGIVIIISIVVLLSLWAALIPEAQTAGESMNDSNRCNKVGCFWNQSITVVTPASVSCRSNSSLDPAVSTEGDNSTGCASAYTIPMSGLFGGRGIVIVLLMFLALIVGLRIVLQKDKGKR